MIEKIAPIKNPLTIIAMFAAIAEISGTVVLPFISVVNQGLYIWFLIIFPLLLISSFFLTLNFNHRVLYAPSDYKDEGHFIFSLTPATRFEKNKKVDSELVAASAAEVTGQVEMEGTNLVASIVDQGPKGGGGLDRPQDVEPDPVPTQDRNVLKSTDELQKAVSNLSSKSIVPSSSVKMLQRENYLLFERRALEKIAQRFGGKLQRDVKIGGEFGVIVDGVVSTGGGVKIIEVKLVQRFDFSATQIFEYLHKIESFAKTEFSGKKIPFGIVLVVVVDGIINTEIVSGKLREMKNSLEFDVEIVMYSRDSLLKD